MTRRSKTAVREIEWQLLFATFEVYRHYKRRVDAKHRDRTARSWQMRWQRKNDLAGSPDVEIRKRKDDSSSANSIIMFLTRKQQSDDRFAKARPPRPDIGKPSRCVKSETMDCGILVRRPHDFFCDADRGTGRRSACGSFPARPTARIDFQSHRRRQNRLAGKAIPPHGRQNGAVSTYR
jgi:hypothetical protein